MDSAQSLHSRGYSEVYIPKSQIFGKEIRSWKSFTWEEWLLVAATAATLMVSLALLCAFVERQISIVDWKFTVLNLIRYSRFGFILYYVIYGLLNEESFAMVALTGSFFLHMLLVSYINVSNFRTEFGFSETVNVLFNVSVFVPVIAIVASAVLTCRYWRQSLFLFLDIDDVYVDNAAKTSAIGRNRLIVKSLLAFEIQWSLVCLSVVIQQYTKSPEEDSIGLTVGFLLVILRAVISWILIGRRIWRGVNYILNFGGVVLVQSQFIYFYMNLVVDLHSKPLTISGLLLMISIFVNHILIIIITDASSSSCVLFSNAQLKRGEHPRLPGETYNLLSMSSTQGTASTTVHSIT